ncbi:MAG: hypothetical protein M3Y50_00675 [Acidobacteriota bacterium]|nr:hypothetical protein [Acidobacteriota bacterium]
MRVLPCLCLAAAMLSASASLAPNPFVGSWKIKTAPGQVLGEVETFEPAANGSIRQIRMGLPPATFTLDGKGVPGASHTTVAWQKINDHVFQCTTTASFMPPVIETYTVSDDNNSLLYDYFTHQMMNYHVRHNVTHYVRISGGKGLIGTWKNADIVTQEEAIMRWTPSGPNAIHMEMPDMHASVELSLDGRECHLVGPMVPPSITASATRTGPRSFDLTSRMNGRVLGRTSYQLSDDGQTLTAVVTRPNGTPPATEVYGRVL